MNFFPQPSSNFEESFFEEDGFYDYKTVETLRKTEACGEIPHKLEEEVVEESNIEINLEDNENLIINPFISKIETPTYEGINSSNANYDLSNKPFEGIFTNRNDSFTNIPDDLCNSATSHKMAGSIDSYTTSHKMAGSYSCNITTSDKIARPSDLCDNITNHKISGSSCNNIAGSSYNNIAVSSCNRIAESYSCNNIAGSSCINMARSSEIFNKLKLTPRISLRSDPVCNSLDYSSDNDHSSYNGIYSRITPLKSLFKTPSQNWSKKSFNLLKSNNLIRSAPLSFGSSVWDLENNGETISLPVLGVGKSDSIKRISGITLINLFNGLYKDKEFLLVDSRFKYEHDGGHIAKSINIFNLLNLENFNEIIKRNSKGSETGPSSKIIIFYCELSSVRGPGMAQKLRNFDRLQNSYPNLNYSEVYVLEGGYRTFYQNFPEFCTPQSYVQMSDKRYKRECVNNHRILKMNKK